MGLTRPRPISASDSLDGFDSASPALDGWLRTRAFRNDQSGASRTYVVLDGDRVVAFYALAVGSVAADSASGRVRRNMPDPVPVMVLARLAVDRSHQGGGLGQALVKDAILRTLQAAEIAGIRALLVHAIDDRAAAFYLRCGFHASPIDPLVLMLGLDEARRMLT